MGHINRTCMNFCLKEFLTFFLVHLLLEEVKLTFTIKLLYDIRLFSGTLIGYKNLVLSTELRMFDILSCPPSVGRGKINIYY